MADASAALKTVSVPGKATSSTFTVPGNWEPLQQLGSGAYAAVAAFRAPNGAEFAVKKIERVFDHPVLALRTLREVRLLAHFRHPNLLCLHDLFLDGQDFKDAYLCIERMDGDLHLLIHGGKQMLSDHQIQCVLYQVMRGLLCLRCAHVIHRDLKPGNVLVKAGGEVKIADLGLARGIDCDEDSHDASLLTEYVVTRFYRAPEVVLTASSYTFAVDMWSTGCILGEMLTRRPVFEGKDSLDQVKKIISILGCQSHQEMDWIPPSSHAWKFVQMCIKNAPPTGEGLQRLVRQPGISAVAVDLLERLLRFDPSKRISVEDALDHSYFEAFVPAEDEEVAAAKAVPQMDWSFDRDLCFHRETGAPRPFDAASFRQAFLDARHRARRQTAPDDGGKGRANSMRSGGYRL